MSIKSHAFGRVTLTGSDARKFKNQVVHGKPKAAAKENVKQGVEISRALQKTGHVLITATVRG
jgi:hypothetical protein